LNISLLPLDSRPCNTLFPRQLGRIAGESINLPDPGFMDYFTRPAWFPYMDEWLLEYAVRGDYFIVSLDMLAYGGLIASRKKSADDPLPRLEILRKMKALNPALKIFAFNVIMRTSITTIDEKSWHYWTLINEYSRLKGLGDPGFAEVERQIPRDVLDSFLSVRERNHRVNCLAVDLLNEKTIDCLTLVQEDTSTGGIQVIEQKILLERISPTAAGFIHNGADEAGMLLLGRVLNAEYPLRMHWEFLNPQRADFTAAYEDRPFIKNLESQIRAGGIEPGGPETQVELLILPPKGEVQQNAHAQTTEKIVDYSAEELDEMAGKIEKLLAAGKTIGLLDIAFANGGHRLFMKTIREKGLLGIPGAAIGAYAAWNTASNSLGTILAQLSAYYRGKNLGLSAEGNNTFTLERYLDDCLYQTDVRTRLEKELKAEGINVLNVGSARGEIEERARRELQLLAPDLDFDFSLPWPRTFEGKITIKNHGAPEAGGMYT
jgi:hypothetical protein